MATEIDAIYEDGSFHPMEPVDLEKHQRVTVIIHDNGTPLSNEEANQPSSDMPTNGAELVAYWERAGVIGSRPDITASVEHARKLRRQAETRQP